MSDDLIRLNIVADASSASGTIREVSTSVGSLNTSLKEAGEAGVAAGNEISEGMEKANFSMMEARHGAMMLGEEIGVKIPRALGSVIAHSETFGKVFATAFSGLAVVGFLEIAEHVGEKLSEWIEKTFIFTDAMKALDKEITEGNKSFAEMDKHIGSLTQQLELVGKSGSAKTGIMMGFKEDEIEKTSAEIRRLQDNMYGLRQSGEEASTAYASLGNQLGLARKHLEELAAEQGVLSKSFDVEKSKEDEAAAKKAEQAEQQLMKIREKAADARSKSIAELSKELEKQDADSAKLSEYQLKTQLEGEQKLSESLLKVGEGQLKINLAQADAAATTQEDVIAKDLALGHTREAIADQQKLVSLLELEKQAQLAIVDGKLAEAQAAMDVSKIANDATGYNNALAEWEKYQAERVKVAAEADKKISQAETKMLSEEHKTLSATLGKLNQEFATFFSQSAAGHERLGQVATRMYTSMANSALQTLATKTMATMEGLTIALLANNTEKISSAKLAAVKAYQAESGIPIIGPALGAAAAASTFAALMAFKQGGIVPSAAGGMLTDAAGPERGTIALLHPNEMVLPAPLSQTVQDMAASASGAKGGSGVHIEHVHAMDGHSFRDFLHKNADKLASGMHKAVDGGHFNIAKAARGK